MTFHIRQRGRHRGSPGSLTDLCRRGALSARGAGAHIPRRCLDIPVLERSCRALDVCTSNLGVHAGGGDARPGLGDPTFENRAARIAALFPGSSSSAIGARESSASIQLEL